MLRSPARSTFVLPLFVIILGYVESVLSCVYNTYCIFITNGEQSYVIFIKRYVWTFVFLFDIKKRCIKPTLISLTFFFCYRKAAPFRAFMPKLILIFFLFTSLVFTHPPWSGVAYRLAVVCLATCTQTILLSYGGVELISRRTLVFILFLHAVNMIVVCVTICSTTLCSQLDLAVAAAAVVVLPGVIAFKIRIIIKHFSPSNYV